MNEENTKALYPNPPQKKKKKKSNAGFIIAIVFLSLITLSSLLVAYQSVKLYKDSLVTEEVEPEITYTQQQVDDMLTLAREEAAETATADFRKDLKETAENSNGIVSMLRKMYPEYFVYYNSNHYEFVEIDHTIPQANFVNENIISNNGFLEYKVDGETKSVKGIDVSEFQGDIDWAKVAESGVKYAMIRLGLRGYGTGKLVTDEKFEANINGALNNGIEVGVYFFTQAITPAEAREEAEYVLNELEGYNITYPVAIDVEDLYNEKARSYNQSKESRTECAVAFMEAVKAKGYTPAIYGNLNTFTKLVEVNKLGTYDKWFALYDTGIYFPYEITIWQYSDKGSVDGIEGTVDLNINPYLL